MTLVATVEANPIITDSLPLTGPERRTLETALALVAPQREGEAAPLPSYAENPRNTMLERSPADDLTGGHEIRSHRRPGLRERTIAFAAGATILAGSAIISLGANVERFLH